VADTLIFRTISTFLCVAVALCGTAAQERWIYSEPVVYVEDHDPGWITLEDKREVRVWFEAPRGLRFGDIRKWSRTTKLLLAYSVTDGPVLVEADTQRSLPIIAGLDDKHPIDRIVDQCLEVESTTQGMVECFDRGSRLWDAEMNRVYRELLQVASNRQKQAVQKAQRAWLSYREAQRDANSAVVTEGTVSRISRADMLRDLAREQARRLSSLLSEAR